MRRKERSKAIEISGQHPIHAVTFSDNGKQILIGGAEGILRWWRVDGKCEADHAIRAEGAGILAAGVSTDCKWLVCGLKGSKDGKAYYARVWDAQTYKKVHDICGHSNSVFSVSISPDSTKFATGSADNRAFIWNITTGKRLIGPLDHDGVVVAVRFSPTGHRIATATAKDREVAKSIRIYNSENGQQLLDIPFSVNTHISSVLAWSADGCRLFAASYSKAYCFDTASSRTLPSEWPVPGGGSSASIALSHNQKFIVVVAQKSLSFWNFVTHNQIGTAVEHASPVWSIALSPGDDWIATGEQSGKVTLWSLRDILPESYFTFNVMSQLPFIHISHGAFNLWMENDLARVEQLLTEDISLPLYHSCALAQRALVRARLKPRDSHAVANDAEKSIKAQRSVIGHIANAMAHVGNLDHESAMRAFDLVFSEGLTTEHNFLLLLKAIISFQCRKHDDAVSRVGDLINMVDGKSLYIAVQAQMLLILADLSLSQGDSERATELLRRAGEASPFQNDPYLIVISLIFGWDFDKLSLEIQSRLQRCIELLECSGDAAVGSRNPIEAIRRYSLALSLNPSRPADLLVRRSKARAMLGSWEEALSDADEAIKADPLGPCGYERKHVALHGLHRYDKAIDAYSRMLCLIKESPDQDVRRLLERYVSPSRSETAIKKIVHEVFDACPLVLIDVEGGHLCDAQERWNTFRSESQFKQLLSSMAIGEERIHAVVRKYFEYVTLSHVWQGKEPLFRDVNLAGSVWELESSPLNDKLRKFCEVVRTEGYRWAWSDTCCIDKTISTVLNRSLTMMYKWYTASAATFVHLADVDSARDSLTDSSWMTRAWTAQELLAPKVIRFYDRHWKPYLGDTHSNHKDSPEIMQEIADAIGVARETVINFNPDDLSIRQKLRLSSKRNAKEKEDVAYSLIGIFKSDIRPHYGEGYAALGHLLEEIVARSGDVTVLAWAGKSSPYNSCLPASLAAYSQPPSAASAIEASEMDFRVAALRNSLPRAEVMLLHDRVTRLPSVRFASRRLGLPCITFLVKRFSMQGPRSDQENHYRARVSGISGFTDFQTSDQLSLAEPHRLIFVHPWIRDLRDPLDGFAWGSTVDGDVSEPETEVRSVPPSASWLHPAAPASTTDDYTRALQLVVRLQQPFHALLLQRQPEGEFKRVATEHEIIVPGLDSRVNFSSNIHVGVVEVL